MGCKILSVDSHITNELMVIFLCPTWWLSPLWHPVGCKWGWNKPIVRTIIRVVVMDTPFNWPIARPRLYWEVAWLPESWDSKIAMSPMGIRTKNDCAGEDHQQYTWPTDWLTSLVHSLAEWNWSSFCHIIFLLICFVSFSSVACGLFSNIQAHLCPSLVFWNSCYVFMVWERRQETCNLFRGSEVDWSSSICFLSQQTLMDESHRWMLSHGMPTLSFLRIAEPLTRKAKVMFMVTCFDWIAVPN